MESVNKLKYCPRCKRYLPLTSFNKNVAQKDGLQIYCADCANAYSMEYQKKRKERILREKATAEKVAANDAVTVEIVAPVALPKETEPEKKTRDQIRKENEGVKREEQPNLFSIHTADLAKELKRRGVIVLINPTPRELMDRLKDMNYFGRLKHKREIIEEVEI